MLFSIVGANSPQTAHSPGADAAPSPLGSLLKELPPLPQVGTWLQTKMDATLW